MQRAQALKIPPLPGSLLRCSGEVWLLGGKKRRVFPGSQGIEHRRYFLSQVLGENP